MNDDSKKISESAERLFDSRSFKKMTGTLHEDLELAFRENESLKQIFEDRFNAFHAATRFKGIHVDLILEEFKRQEINLSNTILTDRESFDDAISKHLKQCSDEYIRCVNAASIDSGLIFDTFEWEGLKSDSEKANSEILKLYFGLTGANSKQIEFLAPIVSEHEFIKLMTNQGIKAKLEWQKSEQLLIYLLDEIATTYLELPAWIEAQMTLSRKELNGWLNPKIVSCFTTKEGKNLTREKIVNLRAQTKRQQPLHLEVITEIIDSLGPDNN